MQKEKRTIFRSTHRRETGHAPHEEIVDLTESIGGNFDGQLQLCERGCLDPQAQVLAHMKLQQTRYQPEDRDCAFLETLHTTIRLIRPCINPTPANACRWRRIFLVPHPRSATSSGLHQRYIKHGLAPAQSKDPHTPLPRTGDPGWSSGLCLTLGRLACSSRVHSVLWLCFTTHPRQYITGQGPTSLHPHEAHQASTSNRYPHRSQTFRPLLVKATTS